MKKITTDRDRRRLSAISALVAASLMAIGLAAKPASAAAAHPAGPAASPAGPATAKAVIPSLQFNSSARVQYRSGAVAIPAAQCSAIRTAMKRAHETAIPKCEIGIGLAVWPVRNARASAQAAPASGTWYTYEEQATACFGDNAIWNGPNGSFSCSEAYFGMSDQFATNGHWLNLHWENPYFATTKGFGLSKTWSGVTGNNTADMVVGDNYNYTYPLGSGTAELRIYNAVCQNYYTCESASAWWQHT